MTAIDIAALAVIVLQVLDMTSTLAAIRRGAREANPLVAWLMRRLGRVAGLALAKGVGVALALALWRLDALWELWALAALYLWVVFHNRRVARRMERFWRSRF